MKILGIEPRDETEEFQLTCAERDLDRGVFCADGFDWRKQTREKLHVLFPNEPRVRKGWKEIGKGLNGNANSLLLEFEDCLPRNAQEEIDPRYFAVHWGIGSIRLEPETFEPAEACARFKHALLSYPDRARANHCSQFADVLQGHVSNGETDAAAIIAKELKRLDACAQCSAGERRTKLQRIFAGLETQELASDKRYSATRRGFTKY